MKNFQKMDSKRQSFIVVVAILLAIMSASTVTYYYSKGGDIVTDALGVPESSSNAVLEIGSPFLLVIEEISPTASEGATEYVTKDDIYSALLDEGISSNEFGVMIEEYLAQSNKSEDDSIEELPEMTTEVKEVNTLPWYKRLFKSKGDTDADIGKE